MSTKAVISKSVQQHQELKELRKENRKLRSKVKQLESGKATLQEQLEQFKTKFAEQKQLATVRLLSSENIARHQYSELLISMCVNMYVLGGCGFRGVIRLLSYFNTTLKWGLTQLPSKSSVENWVLKAGYHLYETVQQRNGQQDYGIIVDECMVVGQERMLAAVSIAAEKVGSEALGLQDVEVLHLKVKSSWDGDAIKQYVGKLTEKMGKPPVYVISDGNCNLRSGFEKGEVKRVADVGHQLALFVEHLYKEVPEFVSFNKDMAQCRLKEVMKPSAYLLPPKQRVIARFMNLSVVVSWAEKMLGIHAALAMEEKQAYAFINRHSPMIRELSHAFAIINELLSVLKKKGLSYKTIAACIKSCSICKNKITGRLKLLMNKIKAYLRDERTKLPDGKTIWHNSSDIIESLFGFYKIRKATNALHGVTPFVLLLPLLTKTDMDHSSINLDFKKAIEGVYMKDLTQWNKDHLIENQIVRRTAAFKNGKPNT